MFPVHSSRGHSALVGLLRELQVLTKERPERSNATTSILRALCRYTGWPLGHAYRLDPASGRLRPTMLWHVREMGLYERLMHATATTAPAAGEGVPGRALASKSIAWVIDPQLDSESAFPRIAAARACGLRTMVAVPVMVAGVVDTVLEFFTEGDQAPDEDLLTVLEYVATSWSRSLELEHVEKVSRSERLAAEQELRLHDSAAAHVRDAIVVSTTGELGGAPTILYVNAAFTRMTGYSEPEVLGRSFGVLAGPKTSRDTLRMLHDCFRRGEPASAEIVAYKKDGTEFLLKWNASPIPEADGSVRHYASIQRDVTEERRVEQALRKVDRDSLTGLPTREVMEQRLHLSIARVREQPEARFALLFMDLDGFKAVNDRHGHVVGDQLLTSAARRLEGTIRPGDALARFGGDEFVVLLHYEELSSVLMVADRIQERMSAPFEIQGETLRIAVSIGVALGSPAYSHPEEVVRDADAAMYEAKRKGKGRIEFFDHEPDGTPAPALRLQ